MSVYLFDFDGTLVDSMPTFAAAVLHVLDKNGVSYPDDIVKIITPLGFAGTADYFIRELGAKRTRDELVNEMTAYMVEAYMNTIPAKPHVERALRALRARGDRLAVLTASPHKTLDPCLKRVGLYDLFERVWSCDDFNTTKADPNIYKMAAKELCIPVEELIFLDDNINADLTAIAAGARVIGVFDASSADMEGEMRKVCHRYIRDFSELV
ncbi:MAG: HAD family phosphatase [Clostridia bacterium]|nr:HAD family phosphatase [Clostridia bacterium]